mgnify:CR=1 FL=1
MALGALTGLVGLAGGIKSLFDGGGAAPAALMPDQLNVSSSPTIHLGSPLAGLADLATREQGPARNAGLPIVRQSRLLHSGALGGGRINLGPILLMAAVAAAVLILRKGGR